MKQAVALVLTLGLLGMLMSVEYAAAEFFFIGSGHTGDKPQSKLWFHDSTWWAILPDGEDIYFYKLQNGVFVKQAFPDARVDTSNSARADVLWNCIGPTCRLFVLMYAGSTARLSKYEYDALTQAYTRLPGFPVTIPLASGSETATIEQDSTGKLWIAYEAGNKIRVLWSTTSDHSGWNTAGLVLHEPVGSDDIAAVVAFNNRIGVMWNNHNTDNFGFRVHVDGEPETSWGPVEVVAQGNAIADDHINLAVTNAQDVLAITKAEGSSNEINLFVRWIDGGWDGPYFVTGDATRPIVVFDQEREDVYVFFTDWSVSTQQGMIAYKKANLLNLIDLALDGSVTVLAGQGLNFNDVSSTKQAVDSATGLLVVAKAGQEAHYTSVGLSPAPDIRVHPISIHFGQVPVGASTDATVTVTNDGTQTLTVSALSTTNPVFSVVSPATPFDVAPNGGSQEVTVRFTPTTEEAETGDLVITSDDPDEDTARVALTGGSPNAVTHEETQTGGSTGATTVTTAAPLAGLSGHLYLAAIATKPHVDVSAVSGLGLSWIPVQAQCAGRNATGVTVWMALGTPSGDGPVTATLATTPKNAVIAVSRYAGADTVEPLGNVVSRNTNGVNGACAGGVDSAAYTVNLSTTVAGAVVYGAIALRNKTHTPGAGYTELVEVSQGSSGDTAGMALEEQTVPAPSAVVVNGAFSGNVDWAVVAVEIKP